MPADADALALTSSTSAPLNRFRPGPGVFPHRRGREYFVDTCILAVLVVKCQLGNTASVAPRVNTEDLIDAHEVARLLGLAQRTSVSVYQNRYPDMPRPVIDMGRGRCKLWQRSAIETWRRSFPSR